MCVQVSFTERGTALKCPRIVSVSLTLAQINLDIINCDEQFILSARPEIEMTVTPGNPHEDYLDDLHVQCTNLMMRKRYSADMRP